MGSSYRSSSRRNSRIILGKPNWRNFRKTASILRRQKSAPILLFSLALSVILIRHCSLPLRFSAYLSLGIILFLNLIMFIVDVNIRTFLGRFTIIYLSNIINYFEIQILVQLLLRFFLYINCYCISYCFTLAFTFSIVKILFFIRRHIGVSQNNPTNHSTKMSEKGISICVILMLFLY